MNDAEFKALVAKIERELPIRLKLAELAGRPKINQKNYKAMEEFDSTIPELFLEVAQKMPQNIQAALAII